MQSCQNWAQAWIDFDEGSWCTTICPHHQDVSAITFDSSACILHALHADLSRLCVLLEIQKSKWYVPSRPLPYAGFFMKRRKYFHILQVLNINLTYKVCNSLSFLDSIYYNQIYLYNLVHLEGTSNLQLKTVLFPCIWVYNFTPLLVWRYYK